MENNQLAKREELGEQSFIERLVSKAESLEDIKKVGMVIIESGFCPDHFKQSKDAVGAIMCIEAGKKLGLSWMQSLSDIYPVKGRIGIMGTAAKAVIFASGVLESWKEYTEGNFPEPEYKQVIISKRKGLPNEFKTEFSVFDATTAGLMGKDIYKKYGKRMILWRALGFHASDYYQDILKGMKTVEELNDYDPGLIAASPAGETTVITQTGKRIKIDPKAASNSEQLSQSAVDKIDKKNNIVKSEEVVQDIQAEAEAITPEISSPEAKIYNTDELTKLGNDIYPLAEKILPESKFKLLSESTGKKSNKKYREAILAFQEGRLDNWLMGAMMNKGEAGPNKSPDATPETPESNPAPSEKNPETPEIEPLDKLFEQKPGGISRKEAEKSFEAEKKPPLQNAPVEIGEPNETTGKRTWPDVISIYNRYEEAGITDENFEKLCENTPMAGKYSSLQGFLETAPKTEVEILLMKVQ